jgi:hypothetical protein
VRALASGCWAITFGRPADDLFVKALMAASQERPGDEANDVVMFRHFLGIILITLTRTPSSLTCGWCSWSGGTSYFALLRHSTRLPQRLSKALASYPEFFVEFLSLLYGPSPESSFWPASLGRRRKTKLHEAWHPVY